MSTNRRSLRFVISLLILFVFSSFVLAQDLVERFDGKRGVVKEVSKEGELGGEAQITSDAAVVFSPEVASSYAFATTTTGSLTDMSTGTTTLVAADQDDTASSVTNLPFDFYFQGVRYNQFSVNSNGTIRLGSTQISTTLYDPLGQAGVPLISPYGADQRTLASTGKVHFKVTGAVGSRILIIEFLNMQADFNAGGTSNLTYQSRLYETTGVIEFVYGSMTMNAAGAADGNSNSPQFGFSSSNTVGTVGSVTAAQSGAPAPTFNSGSAAPVNNLYVAGPITVLTSAVDGTRRTFSFSPPTPTAPGGPLTFTAVTPTSFTLNWTDAPDETLYSIYRSTDGVNYSFFATTAQNVATLAVPGLNPSTNYFWQVYSVSEGAFSTALAGSQATSAPGNVSCNIPGGPWSSPATWSGGVVPSATDNVTIGNNCTVTVDTPAAAFNVTLLSGGNIEFEQITARTLTVSQAVTINSGATIRSNLAGTQTGHVLSIGTDLTNNGTLDLSTNADTAGAGITFTGAANNTFGGTGATTDIRTLTVNKGTSNANILELNSTNFTVRGVTTDTVVGGWLILTNGTMKVSGTFSGTSRVFSAAGYTIGATTGFWLNNPNYVVAGQNGSPTMNGLLRLSQGTYNVGTASGNSMTPGIGSTVTIEGGAFNATGRLSSTAASSLINYTQTGGTVTVATVGNASSGNPSFGFTSSSVFNISGGTIVVQNGSTGATKFDYALFGSGSITGGTLQVGNATTPASTTFVLLGAAPNVVIDNATTPRVARIDTNALSVNGNLTINSGTTLLLNGAGACTVGGNPTQIGNIVNNGAITMTAGLNNRVNFFGAFGGQTYSGSGSFGTAVTPMAGVGISNNAGVTLAAPIFTNRFNLFNGPLNGVANATMGAGGATATIVQIGQAANPVPGGSLDASPIYNFGTGGHSVFYLGENGAGRTTSFEIPPARTLIALQLDNTGNLTIAGGDVNVTGATTLANGRLITGSNALAIGGAGTVTKTNGYVDGNFRKTFSAGGSKTFEVGTANGYSPVAVNATAGTFPADFVVKATQGAAPYVSGPNKLQRFWTLTSPGTIAGANLTFNYLAGDVVGTAANYKFIKNSGGALSTLNPDAPPTTTSATISGVSSFSDWTLAEAGAVMPGAIQFSSAVYSDGETNVDHTFTAGVDRVGGTDGAVSVDYQITDGTATIADNDYSAAPTGTLTWNAGDATQKTLTITVKGDTAFEPDETVNLAISNPQGGAVLGSPTAAVLTITNDDPTPCVPPSTVYVNAAWIGTAIDADPDGLPGAPSRFGCDSFATIQGGINGVTNPGTVLVAAGTYKENPTVNKSLSIRGAQFGVDARTRAGAESVVMTNGSQTAVFSITANDVAIDGFSIDGDDPLVVGAPLKSGEDTNVSYGVRAASAQTNLNIRNNIIRRAAIGFRGDGVSQGSVITQNLFDSIGFFDFGYCVSLRANFYANVVNNKMTRAWTGIHVNDHHGTGGPATFDITGNEISSYAGGILYWLNYNQATGANISGNTLTAETAIPAVPNNFGILVVTLQDAVTPTFTGNTISGHDYGFGVFNAPTTGTVTLDSTNSISGSKLAGVFLTDNLNFNPIGLTNFLLGGPGAASTVDISNLPIIGNLADGIRVEGVTNAQNIVVTGSTITGTSGARGLVFDNTKAGGSVTTSTVTGFGTGIAFPNNGGSSTPLAVNYNRIISGTSAVNGSSATAIADLKNNWWGCNAGPGNAGCGTYNGASLVTPWVVLGTTAAPTVVPSGGISLLTANMTKNSASGTLAQNIPTTPVAYTAVNGSMSPTSGSITAGTDSSVFTAASTSPGQACATVDNQLKCSTIIIQSGSIPVTPVTPGSATPTDNDYTRINNAVQAITNGGTITLNGTFNWTEPNAAASWALGSDGISQGGGGDDYEILVPANLNGVTFTAPTQGGATIQGPGDVPTVNLEGVLVFDGGDNQSWTISNINFFDFDLSIGFFNGAGGTDAFNNTHIVNNHIRIPADLNTTVAPGDAGQNIGIHFSFGTNQVISGNTIDFAGNAISDGASSSAEVGVQSNTSGGNAFDGLQITNNTLNVLNAQSANPEVILGIWENGHAHSSNITVSGNQFLNPAAGNNPATNLQRGFRVTSHSSLTTTVLYKNNTVTGANIGFQWITGSNFTGNQPVVVKGNTITGNGTGVLVQSNGQANLSFNRIVGNTTTGLNNLAGSVTAENNWWGKNTGPNTAGADTTVGTVDSNPWLVLTGYANPTTVPQGGTSTITADLTTNSDLFTVGDTPPNTLPTTPVAFSTTTGTISPTNTNTVDGKATSIFTATSASPPTICATVDNQQICNVTITVFVVPTIQFHATTYKDDENQTATVLIDRGGDTSGTVSALFTTGGGTATAGGLGSCGTGPDYESVSQVVTFGPAVTQMPVMVKLCSDTLNEATDETIGLTLSSPGGGATLVAPFTATLAINDTASQFFNATPIDMSLGSPAAPYPSTITVTGAPTIIGRIRVTLFDVYHANPDNIDVLLVGPGLNGGKYVLMGDVGGPIGNDPTTPVTLTFSDLASGTIPDGGPWATGQFLPTTCMTPVTNFPAPAPAGSYNEPGCGARLAAQTMFGSFGLSNANGLWSLYVRDDNGALRPFGEDRANSIIGSIGGGWGLEFIAATAGEVSLSGRVTAGGRGVTNATITVTGNSLSSPIVVRTGRLGAYQVNGLHAGETYVVTVSARRFTFAQPSRVMTLNDNLTDVDFLASVGAMTSR